MNKRQREICQQIYEENKEKLHWYLWKHFNWLNPEDAHDIMQEVWRILSENIQTVSGYPPAAQWGWLKTVAHNLVVSFIRKESKGTEVGEKLQEKYAEPQHDRSAENVAIDRVMAKNILGKLSQEDKMTIFKPYLHQDSSKGAKKKSNAEICKTYRAKKRLQEEMKEGGMDD